MSHKKYDEHVYNFLVGVVRKYIMKILLEKFELRSYPILRLIIRRES